MDLTMDGYGRAERHSQPLWVVVDQIHALFATVYLLVDCAEAWWSREFAHWANPDMDFCGYALCVKRIVAARSCWNRSALEDVYRISLPHYSPGSKERSFSSAPTCVAGRRDGGCQAAC